MTLTAIAYNLFYILKVRGKHELVLNNVIANKIILCFARFIHKPKGNIKTDVIKKTNFDTICAL
jgi:hypothetical protein